MLYELVFTESDTLFRRRTFYIQATLEMNTCNKQVLETGARACAIPLTLQLHHMVSYIIVDMFKLRAISI